jgi:hypothetical protein
MTTPIKVKKNNCETIKKKKYLAMTARSSLECVVAPWYFDSQRMMKGSARLKTPMTTGGK